VNGIEVIFLETSATERIVALPLSHLSIELGHLYMEDFEAGPDHLLEMFQRVAPWARTAQEVCASGVRAKTPRVSTCFLIDDYFSSFSTPREVIPMVLAAAKEAGLRIDYLARESACAEADGIPLASMVVTRLVADPPPGANGTRPPTQETGWVCNGTPSPRTNPSEAMTPEVLWKPPSENGANRHSIFVDVQLWDEQPQRRRWSCPLLAAVWQLLRLGVLRHQGEAVAVPRSGGEPFPDAWAHLPAITQLNPQAAPFSAYRTFSVLDSRFLPIELAVRTILSQVAIESGISRQLLDRAANEQLKLPLEVVNRIEYAFAGGSWLVSSSRATR
jgi:hypothetical protein